MTEPPTDLVGEVQPSDPALLAVLDACEEYVSVHHELLRTARRASLAPAATRSIAAHLDQLIAAAREARNHLPHDDTRRHD